MQVFVPELYLPDPQLVKVAHAPSTKACMVEVVLHEHLDCLRLNVETQLVHPSTRLQAVQFPGQV